MTRKKMIIIGLCMSAAVFLVLLIRSVITAVQVFSNPDGFNLMPWLTSVALLILLVCHFAFYVFIMDKKPATTAVTDIDEWWTKWDRV